MAAITHILTILFLLFTPILANVEKTIFLGPKTINTPFTHPTLSNLRLATLTPINGTLRTQLAAQFPTTTHPLGTATWLILDKLTPNQRYEVRVCWPATVSPCSQLPPTREITNQPPPSNQPPSKSTPSPCPQSRAPRTC